MRATRSLASAPQSLAITLCLLALLPLTAPPADACTTIIVGKEASADGSVLVAHNEDDDPPQIVVHTKVPRVRHDPGPGPGDGTSRPAGLTLPEGPTLPQPPETWAFLWMDLPGTDFSESGLNEWGVCVTSDNCPSREDRADLTEGGIAPTLRRLVVERARTAREGVRLAADLVERYGYQASGRTYVIDDPDEAWLFSVVRGRHWLAWRVPDDEVCVLPNRYIVRQVDLKDADHVLAAPDIADYAASRGWHDPQRDGAFDFARAYADPRVAQDPSNYCRQWAGLRRFAEAPPGLGPDLPASVKPKRKIGVADLMAALRDHYEGTDLAHPQAGTGDPHPGSPGTICSRATQASFVAQLRRGELRDVDLVYWVALGRPCTSCFVPFHYGIQEFPAGWRWSSGAGGAERPDAATWRAWVEPPFRPDESRAYATAVNFQRRMEEDYAGRIEALHPALDAVEARALSLQPSFEAEARSLWRRDPEAAAARLLDFSQGVWREALAVMSEVARGKTVRGRTLQEEALQQK